MVPFLFLLVVNNESRSSFSTTPFISNNGLLVTAITDILFYTDLIGTMVEIN